MSDNSSSTKTIKRLKYTLKSSEFGKLHDIRIHQYLGSSTKGLAALSFRNVKHLSKPLAMPKEVGYDLLWQTSRSLRNDPTPNWLGFMQELLKNETSEEINYCRKNIHLVTSPTVNCRYGESLCFIWASKLCQKRSSLCSANDVPVRKASVDS